MARITLDQILNAVQDDYMGICIACGNEQEGVEPDARGYECEDCGKAKVYGAEELLMMTGAVQNFTDQPLPHGPILQPFTHRSYR